MLYCINTRVPFGQSYRRNWLITGYSITQRKLAFVSGLPVTHGVGREGRGKPEGSKGR